MNTIWIMIGAVSLVFLIERLWPANDLPKVNTDSGLEYLKDKNWTVFRPEKVNRTKLREFVKIAREKGNTKKKAYDYSGAFGLKNASDKPDTQDEISSEYTCCTLITAALYYSGYELHCTKRSGVLDIVTPKQVVTSWGCVRDFFE